MVPLSTQGLLTPTTTEGKQSFTLSLTDVGSAVVAVEGNDGHPELRNFAKLRAAGPAQLDVVFVPNAKADGSHASIASLKTGVELSRFCRTAEQLRALSLMQLVACFACPHCMEPDLKALTSTTMFHAGGARRRLLAGSSTYSSYPRKRNYYR